VPYAHDLNPYNRDFKHQWNFGGVLAIWDFGPMLGDGADHGAKVCWRFLNWWVAETQELLDFCGNITLLQM